MSEFTNLDQALCAAAVAANSSLDSVITVDVDTREITMPESEKLFGVEDDEKVEIKHIKLNKRFIDGDRDLSQFQFRISYENANGEKNYDIATNLSVSESAIEFDWLLGRSATLYNGTTSFIVCAVSVDASTGNVTNEWNSAIGRGDVKKGIKATVESIGGKDLVAQLQTLISTATWLNNNAIEASSRAQNYADSAAASSATAKASEDAAAISATNAEDSSNRVTDSMKQIAANKEAIGQLKDGKISKFYASSQGNTNLPDSDNGRIVDLKLYGKSNQDGTPTPDNPAEIKSVVNPMVKVMGKNLFKITATTTTVNGVTHTIDHLAGADSLSGTSTGWGNLILFGFTGDGKTYTVSGSPNGDKNIFISVNDGSKDIAVSKNGMSESFVAAIGAHLNVIACIGIGVDCGGVIIRPQLELGSTATDFEPYIEAVATLPYTLNAIPVSSGGNVIIDGQQYIADYVDVERGKLVRMVGKRTFLKQTRWSKAVNNGVFRFYAGVQDALGIEGSKVKKNSFAISSHFVFTIKEPDKVGYFTMNADGFYANIGFAFSTDSTTTSNDFNNWILSNKPFLFFEVPKEELPLTTEQIQTFKALATYYPTTNISVGSDELDGYTVFNYPISLANGWNYVKQQIGDTRNYMYDIDLVTAESYVNSAYATAIAEMEV